MSGVGCSHTAVDMAAHNKVRGTGTQQALAMLVHGVTLPQEHRKEHFDRGTWQSIRRTSCSAALQQRYLGVTSSTGATAVMVLLSRKDLDKDTMSCVHCGTLPYSLATIGCIRQTPPFIPLPRAVMQGGVSPSLSNVPVA